MSFASKGLDITLLKNTCHFLLLLVGFDTLTYRKELQLTNYTCGSSKGQAKTVSYNKQSILEGTQEFHPVTFVMLV